MGEMTISTANTKAYANEQRTMSNEPYSKQTQSNPIFSPPFFTIPASALGYTTLSLQIRISRDRAPAEGKSGGAGFYMKMPDLQYEANVQEEDESGNSL